MNQPKRRAQSLYRQLRITVTQEQSGRLTYSIYAKGLGDSWNEHHCLVRDHVDRPPWPLATTDDVVHALIEVLQEQVLPGSIV